MHYFYFVYMVPASVVESYVLPHMLPSLAAYTCRAYLPRVKRRLMDHQYMSPYTPIARIKPREGQDLLN